MFNSTVLEVVIGLCFAFASISLIASSVNEAIASAFKLRADTLLDGIKSMLNDQKFDGLARDIYNHALVNPHAAGAASSEDALTHKPSYVDRRAFAIALIESLQKAPGNFAELGADIANIKNEQLRKVLLGMYQRADNSLDTLQEELSSWFDHSMDRVSGVYKRRSQLVCFLLALGFAMLLNVDAIRMFTVLWHHPSLTAQLEAHVALDSATLGQLYTLPIGWSTTQDIFHQITISAIFGWLITASSALFGAPFWFDALQKLVDLRGAGKRKDEKSK